MPATESIFPTRDNVSLVLFKKDNVAVDFSGATRFLLTFGSDTVDTDINATAITTTANPGELQFDLGGLTLTSTGFQQATLIVFDPINTNGQVLACLGDKLLNFNIKEC